MSILDLLEPEQPATVKQVAEQSEAETMRAVADLMSNIAPLIEVKRQYTLATTELKEKIQRFQSSIIELQGQLGELTGKLESLETSKREINALEKELLTKLLQHPELNR